MRSKILLFLVLASFLAIPFRGKTQVNVQDSLALVDLYNSTNGPAWTRHDNWLTKSPMFSWYGVTVKAGRIETLNFVGNNITGTIPASIGNLTGLTLLQIASCHLSDTLPASIGNLSSLVKLNLGKNNLSGNVPTSIGYLTSLAILNLEYNQFSGEIPASIGKLTNLTDIILPYNKFSGIIPLSIGNMASLQSIDLSNNQLTGDIPSTITNITKLTIVDLDANHLNGTVPSFANYPNKDLLLFLSHNYFTFNALEAVAQNVRATFDAEDTVLPIKSSGNILSVNAGGTLANNHYVWRKDGAYIADYYGYAGYTPTEIGKYTVFVTNKSVKYLTLYSDTINIKILPVTLLNFTANFAKTAVNLTWQTAQEINTGNYSIERSLNGNAFTTIGKVQATGNSTTTTAYSFSDFSAAALNTNALYYRLKITDKDGSCSYSKIINLHYDAAGSKALVVYPNPVRDNCMVQFTAPASRQYIITVTDAKGRVLKRAPIAATAGINKAAISLKSLPAASYFIIISGGRNNETLRVMKE